MQQQKHVTEDICKVRHNTIMNSIVDMRTDIRLLTESYTKYKMKSIESDTKQGVCLANTKKSIDKMQTDINILVDNCTKPKQESKGGIIIGKDVAIKLIGFLTVITLLIYGIVFKGSPELVMKVLGG